MDKAGEGRRDFLKFLAGLGLGAGVAEVYERLYSIPSLERRFREEVGYWVGKYNSAYAELNNLTAQHNAAERRIEELTTQQSSAEKRIEELTLQVRSFDKLEDESTAAILLYRQRMDEAINGLRKTIEKYRAILGDERVLFEQSSLSMLEELKVTKEELKSTNEKLLKLLPYFPLIKDLAWRPTRVVNDKVYDVNVSLEVISPLNTLKELEVSLIPVEYSHLSREAFPKEEVKIVRINPRGLERKVFSADFYNLRGGIEYVIEVTAKDTAGNAMKEVKKTPYIREYENFGKKLYEKGVLVISVIVPFDMRGILSKDDDPLLGRYDMIDELVGWKHVDWATGHGINIFVLDSQNHWWPDIKKRAFKVYQNISMTREIKVVWLIGPSRQHFIYGEYGKEIPEWAIDLSIQHNHETFISFAREILKPELILDTNYLKIDGGPVLYIWAEGAFFNQKNTYETLKRLIEEKVGMKLYIIANWIPWIPTLPDNNYVQFLIRKYRGEGLRVVNAYTGWIGFHNVGLDTAQYVNNYPYYYERHLRAWREFTKRQGKDFIVTVTPGFDNSYSWGGPQIPLPRGRERFEERLKIGLKYLDDAKPMIIIDTWNDWGEWSYIDPSVNEGFSYLEVLRNSLETMFGKL